MKYVSEKYQAQLDTLAEELMAARREKLAPVAGSLTVEQLVLPIEQ